MLQTLIRLFHYDGWANNEALRSLRQMANPPAGAIRLLSHIVAVEWLWLDRMRGVPQSLPVWPEWSLDELEAQLPRAREAWKVYLDEKKDLASLFQYTNTKGERYSNTLADGAMHVPFHGAYHRGQIAALVRDHDGQPAYTDFIQAARTGKI